MKILSNTCPPASGSIPECSAFFESRERNAQRPASQSGATSLELALVLPVLLLFIFGALELGYMYFASATMDKAAHYGARAAVTGEGYDNGSRQSRIESAVYGFADSFTGGANDTLSLEVNSYDPSGGISTPGAGGPCDVVEVKVSYTYQPLTPFVDKLLNPTFTVTGVERMVNEPYLSCS